MALIVVFDLGMSLYSSVTICSNWCPSFLTVCSLCCDNHLCLQTSRQSALHCLSRSLSWHPVPSFCPPLSVSLSLVASCTFLLPSTVCLALSLVVSFTFISDDHLLNTHLSMPGNIQSLNDRHCFIKHFFSQCLPQ